jgi:uncharacterized membrane protein YoaK (UPF0700 family)
MSVTPPRPVASSFKPLPLLLSFNAGYVDATGFLALQGLFTAHVTGNFVTLGAALVMGSSGILAKLLALPMFCAAIIVVRLVSFTLPAGRWPVLRTMITLKVALLTLAAVLAVRFGPFHDGDAWMAVVVGLLLVSAMAIQNAVQRVHLGTEPPTTIMTGNTTQMMIDVADLLRGVPPERQSAIRARLSRMGASVMSFAAGCAAAALCFLPLGVYCFVVPPIIGLATLMLRMAVYDGGAQPSR